MNEKSREGSWHTALLGVGCIAFAVPLSTFVWTGTFMRLTGDDYCYAGMFRQHGFLETLRSTYFGPSPFHGNRFSLTVASGLAELLGPRAYPTTTAAVLALWVVGLALLVRAATKAASVDLKPVEALFAGEMLAFFSLILAPEVAQSLYWRSGMLPYLAPIVLLPILFLMIMNQTRSEHSSSWRLGLIGLLAFLAAGFSETAAALQLTVLAAAVAAVVLFWRAHRRRPTLLRSLMAALAGTGVATLLLLAAPTNASRLAEHHTVSDVGTLAALSIHHAYLYLHGLAFRHPPTLISIAILALWLAFYASSRNQPLAVWHPSSFVAAGGVLLIGWIATVLAVMLPSAYAQSSYPVGRALVLAAFSSTAAIAGLGALSGAYLAGSGIRGKILPMALSLLFVAACLTEPIPASARALADLPSYRRWASFWDARDSEIRQTRDAGIGDIEVVLIDKIIPDVAELQPDPDYWYNNCAEWYYDLDRLSASLPGWDE